MEMQKIEPLLMDYALGATDTEVSALVEALAAKDGHVRTQLEQWGEVAALAKRAEAVREMANVPVFPRQGLESARRAAIWRRTAVQVAAIAACLMLGFFVGSVNERNRELTLTGDMPQMVVANTTIAGEVPVAAVKEFWSPARLVAVAQSNAERPAPARSPVGNSSTMFFQSGG